MKKVPITFVPSEDSDVAYVYLRDMSSLDRAGEAKKQVRLSNLIKYNGADIVLDFDALNNLIGIEILAF